MKALLIIAHGSRSPAANEEVERLAARIGSQSAGVFDRVAHAFLEIADPGAEPAIGNLADAGAAEIKVFPYFLAAGAHVAQDIPRVIDKARTVHPHIRFEILPYLGALEGIAPLVIGLIEEAGRAQR